MTAIKLKQTLNTLGPGLLYAGAAVGVSHLVQSTRAGAEFGFYLAGILILANVLKYPFFEFGPRYAASTGKNLIDGYGRLGKWALYLFALLTIGTMFAIQAAVTAVTAGILAFVLNISLSPNAVYLIVTVSGGLLLLAGRYTIIDRAIKLVIILLTVSTLIAVVLGLNKGYSPVLESTVDFSWVSPVHIFFLIAFVGWMPAPIDLSVWHSLWSVAKQKSSKHKISLKQALTDFKIGYIGTAFLALGFLSLGALVMHGSGESLSPRGAVFAGQLIGMYTASLGTWTYPVISIAALTTMISTTLTAMDAYPRVMQAIDRNLINKADSHRRKQQVYRYTLLIGIAGSTILFVFLSGSMRFMVDLATTLSFITAPILALLNFKVIHGSDVPAEARPPVWLRWYGIISIVLLSAFTLFYIAWNFLH